MKAYIVTTGIVFALLVIAHVWRIMVEGSGILNPWFIAITVAAGAISIWAWSMLFRMSRRSDS